MYDNLATEENIFASKQLISFILLFFFWFSDGKNKTKDGI